MPLAIARDYIRAHVLRFNHFRAGRPDHPDGTMVANDLKRGLLSQYDRGMT